VSASSEQLSISHWTDWCNKLLTLGPALVVLLRRILDASADVTGSGDQSVLHVLHIDAFQLMAWGVALYLLNQQPSIQPVTRTHVVGALVVCVIGSLSSIAGIGFLSLYLIYIADCDVRRWATATVFVALFCQQAIVPWLYDLLVPTMTRLDTLFVGTAVQWTIPGATWQDDIITVPSGHSIEILAGCCSLRNVSLASLCWVALTKLERPIWSRYDITILAAAAGFQILLNVVRIYLMAMSPDMYLYWHDGMGEKIFAICASAAAVLISSFGARWVTLNMRR
jgi:exosortase/archaeosortase family protein